MVDPVEQGFTDFTNLFEHMMQAARRFQTLSADDQARLQARLDAWSAQPENAARLAELEETFNG